MCSSSPLVRVLRSFALCILVCSASAVLATEPLSFVPEYSSIAPGLDYAHLRDTNTNHVWSIHIARLEWKRKDLSVVTTLAKNKVQGLESLSEQLNAFPTTLQPVVAINGDFFHIKPGPYQGVPQGLELLAGELITAPSAKCLWLDRQGTPHIDVLTSRAEITWPRGNKQRLSLNDQPATNGITLFTPTFGPSTQATNAIELVLERVFHRAWLPLRLNESYRGRVVAIATNGNTLIASNRMVLTLTGTAKTNLARIEHGDILRFTTTSQPKLARAAYAIGGSPILVRDGAAQFTADKSPRHPRTAVGFNSRYLYLVAVDGRQPDLSIGMNWPELSALMKQIGCTEALNLDGGGSTTFWLNGKVMNSPSDKHERSIANALAIVKKVAPGHPTPEPSATAGGN